MNPLHRLHAALHQPRTLRYQQRRTRLEHERLRRDDAAYGDMLATARAMSRGDELAGILGLGFVDPGYCACGAHVLGTPCYLPELSH